MFASIGGILLGVLVGLRHAFEPDHLTAVSTLAVETSDARRSTLLGVIWGIGHTAALAVVGTLLLATGALLPQRTEAVLELAVALMLIVLGVRSLWLAAREGRLGAVHRHHHADAEHVHAGPDRHLHLGSRTFALRPLIVGLVHGLAGSGAMTALVFAELPDAASRMLYIVLFGLGSILGMAVASGLVGASLQRVARTPSRRRAFAIASGALSIALGIAWGLPRLSAIG
jgi:high-affinity nickel-transport protein